MKGQLNVNANKACSKSRSDGSAAVTGERLRQRGALQQGAELLTAEEYVARTLPLLELEREAEVAQVKRSLLKRAFHGSEHQSSHLRACVSVFTRLM